MSINWHFLIEMLTKSKFQPSIYNVRTTSWSLLIVPTSCYILSSKVCIPWKSECVKVCFLGLSFMNIEFVTLFLSLAMPHLQNICNKRILQTDIDFEGTTLGFCISHTFCTRYGIATPTLPCPIKCSLSKFAINFLFYILINMI